MKELLAGFSASAVTVVVKKMFQPPLSGALLLGAARHHGLPVHRLQVDLEADLFERCLADRRQLVGRLQVGRLHHDDRRAVIAALLQELARLVEIGLDQAAMPLLFS